MEAQPTTASSQAEPPEKERWSGASSRRITERIVVEGKLVLQEPAHFGTGEEGEFVDMPLLVDPLDGAPILTGATLAGALRAHLRARTFGYYSAVPDFSSTKQEKKKEREGPAVQLLGGYRTDDEGEQSALIVCDACGKLPKRIGRAVELREGVAIDPETRTAEEGKLFDLEAWPAGTCFPLRFELVITDDEDASNPDALRKALCTALAGLQKGEITLGARKRRGYGKATVETWRVRRYNLTEVEDLLAWLEYGSEDLLTTNRLTERCIEKSADLWDALDAEPPAADHRAWFHLCAKFSLDGSLLIRSGLAPEAASPDMAHLQALRPDGEIHPVLSGTSLAGALRARARKIARTLNPPNPDQAIRLIAEMFGYGPEDEVPGLPDDAPSTRASRVQTREHAVEDAEHDLVQSRVSIDRFTGGAYPGALFDQQPAFGDEETTVTVEMRLLNPKDHEVGLLLLLLKDLWTSDLPLGGERSVGRGRLKGKEAHLTLRKNRDEDTWRLEADSEHLHVEGRRETLEDYVHALKNYLEADVRL